MTANASVLYVMYGMPSCYSSGFTFAKAFPKDGVDITIACDQNVHLLAKSAGVPFIHLNALSKQNTNKKYLALNSKAHISKVGKILNYPKKHLERLKLRNALLKDDEYISMVNRIKPDLIIIDIECHYAIVASHTLDIPFILCSRLFNQTYEAGIPPLHSCRQPATNIREKIAIEMEWCKLRISSWILSLKQSITPNRLRPVHYRSHTHSDIKAISAYYDVKLTSISTRSQWLRPVAYTIPPVVSLTLSELDYGTANRNKFTHLGPMVAAESLAFATSRSENVRLKKFLSTAKSNNRRLIYCAMGTYANREPRFVNAIRALALLRPNYAFIIALGNREPVERYSDFPSNSLLVAHAPQIECMSQSDAAILHSGIASLQEALVHRVPAICFSVGSVDQNGNLSRWIQRELAYEMSLEGCSGSSVAELLDRVLNDSKLARNLELYGQIADQKIQSFSPKSLVKEYCL